MIWLLEAWKKLNIIGPRPKATPRPLNYNPLIPPSVLCLLGCGIARPDPNDFKKDTSASSLDPDFIGLDISKEAIVAASKRNKDITWVVGTNRQPPIVAGSVDIIFCVFGFHSFQGFNKILPVRGKLLLVEPGPDHLQELRQVTYPQLHKTALNKLDDAFAMGFKQVGEQILRFNTPPLPNESIKDLLLMTPHFFRATQEGREAAGKLDGASLTVDLAFRSLEKTEYYWPEA